MPGGHGLLPRLVWHSRNRASGNKVMHCNPREDDVRPRHSQQPNLPKSWGKYGQRSPMTTTCSGSDVHQSCIYNTFDSDVMRLKTIEGSAKDGKDGKVGAQATASRQRVHCFKVCSVGRHVWRWHGQGCLNWTHQTQGVGSRLMAARC